MTNIENQRTLKHKHTLTNIYTQTHTQERTNAQTHKHILYLLYCIYILKRRCNLIVITWFRHKKKKEFRKSIWKRGSICMCERMSMYVFMCLT